MYVNKKKEFSYVINYILDYICNLINLFFISSYYFQESVRKRTIARLY